MGKGVDHNENLVLNRHRARRVQGVPTLSVLVGDVDVACWCWTGWQRNAGVPFVCTAATGRRELLRDWLASDALHGALTRALMSRGSAENDVSVQELELRLRARPAGQRQRTFEQLSAQLGHSSSLIAALAQPQSDALASWVFDGFPQSLVELRALPVSLPGLLMQPPRSASSGELRELLTTALQISEIAAHAELACALSEAQLVRWRQEADARELHLVNEGLIRVEPLPDNPPPDGNARRRTRSSQRRAAAPNRDAPNTLVPRLEYDPAEFARSRAERALFEHLQGRPRTQGLFALNAMIPEPFGSRALEVDLLSEALRVALEVDGYHHFRDAAAYRRDRDKDILLQRLGYTVVRVLASDVHAELDYVTETIDRVVEHEQRRRAP